MLQKSENHLLNGQDAFKLYDTYGFPLELTVEIAQESGFEVDEEGFKAEMKAQQERARNARGDMESMCSQKPDLMAFDEPSEFIYNPAPIQAKVIATFVDGVKCDAIDTKGEIILDQTTFYAEMGGQCADTGTMNNESTDVNVTYVCKAPHQQHLHTIHVTNGSVKTGDVLTLHVDMKKRALITHNHTATHLLQKALKNVLGGHVSQAGSYVDDQRLRFDFTHPQKVTDEELKQVEDQVNEQIFNGLDVCIQSMSKDEAMKSGAMALFDEKYGDVVRVVSVGDYSKELCGGCHVSNSIEIGIFKIVGEESIGSGVRRIEAVTSIQAYRAFKESEALLNQVQDLLKIKNKNETIEKVTHFIEETNELRKERNQYLDQINALSAKEQTKNIEDINGVQFLFVEESKDVASAKQMAFDLRDQLQHGFVVMVNTYEGKISYFVALTKSMVKDGYKAGDMIKTINQVTNGRGGGKPDFAQGGCQDASQIKEAIAQIKAQF